MDYGIQNSHHYSAAPQTILQPQPQPQQQQPAAHLYSAYYSAANANPYPNQIVRHEDPSPSALVFADGGVAQVAEQYAVESGFDAQAVQYGAYQQTAPYPYAQALAAASFQQAKRKLKMHSNILDLEEKKQKVIEGGAAADAIRVCTICNVVCNSATVFASHLAGEKHALKAIGKNYGSMAPKVMAQIKQMRYAKKSAPNPLNKMTSSGFNSAPKVIQTLTCEVCKIDCNSQETLNTHKMGKKHKGNLQKLQEKITPKPPAADKKVPAGKDQTANAEAAKKAASATKEDLQTKKEKVVQGGAAEEDIMVCALCDVVCNSKAVYESHIAGKKHLSMIKKQDAPRV